MSWHIVYPRGDRSKLAIVEIIPELAYELNDYVVASRRSFEGLEEATVYARQLAKDNDKVLELDNDQAYLD